MPDRDEIFMRRCIDLALQGIGKTSPNPMVGCVIIHEDRIIGEGYHAYFGGPHAEVNAIDAVQEEDVHLLPGSILYVNLEPCSHFGKTPPCADLIIKENIGGVVIGTTDPNPLVAGKGIERLRNAFESDKFNSRHRLVTGILETDCKKLNKRFFTWIEKRRPYVILKWAQTTDGFITSAKQEKINISNEYSRTLVHKWRSEEQAILVGTRTALNDDPVLDARNWNNHHPVRLVIDRTLRLSRSLHLFDHSIRTFIFTERKKSDEENLEFITLDFSKRLAEKILHQLFERDIQSVLIEGGSQLLQTFIDASLWDEARIFIAPKFFKDGIPAPRLSGKESGRENIFDDELIFITREA